MKNYNAYESLFSLSPIEESAKKYYFETGRYLKLVDIHFLHKTNSENDYSRIGTEEYNEFVKKFKKSHHSNDALMLTERSHIPEFANVNVISMLRYIDIAEHRHEFYEIVCILKGECVHTANGKSIYAKEGDIIFVPPQTLHTTQIEPNTIGVLLQIRTSSFANVFSPLLRSGTTLKAFFTNTLYSHKPCESITFHCQKDAFLYETILYMYAQQKNKMHHYARVLDGLTLTFFAYLLQNYEDEIDFSNTKNFDENRAIAIERYIRLNHRTATLVDTAEHFGLNPAYLSKLTKEKTGYNFSFILRYIRMERAADLLKNTEMKIEQICESVGYCDTTQFIKTFKKQYNMTPSNYRKSVRKNP